MPPRRTRTESPAPTCPWPLPAQGIDIPLLVTVLMMVAFGLLMVYSSSFIYAQERTGDGFAFIKKQVIFAGLGILALLGACRLDYRSWARWAYPLLGLAVTLLALVFVPGLGAKVGGAQRWLRLGPAGFQPGELAKFAVIFFVAYQLDRKRERLGTFTAGILSYVLLTLPAFALLLAQPDFGSTVMILLVMFSLMFLAGVPARFLYSGLGLGGIVGAFLAFGSEYRKARLLTFLDPWQDPGGNGFQILQSLVGVHQGSLLGAGLGNGKEKLFYLPEAHNDFILAVIGEELGFMGIAGVAVAYLYFMHRGFRIAWASRELYQDRFGMYLAAGITLAIGLQGFINMSVVLGLLPTKGLTLPLISYGGSALLMDLFAVGVLLSVARGPQSRLKEANG
jgi:cell division protein FtsW